MVTCFAISPKGTFLVSAFEDFISLKVLPEGMVSEFKDSIEPFYYSEVMGTPEFSALYGQRKERDLLSSMAIDKQGTIEEDYDFTEDEE